MIRIRFEEPKTKIWKRWVEDCTQETNDLKKNYAQGEPIEIKELYRRKSIKQEVYFAKDGPFRGRCAYCEAHIADFQHGDIEHFRPKKTVTDENDVPIMVARRDGKRCEHPGYYWLAYQWRNLLPSCIKCNQPGEEGIGKRNRFPLQSPTKHGIAEDEMAQERPYLFNPIDPNDEDPEDHLGIDLETGLITYKNDSKRAEMCAKIFGLNKRDQLVNERKAAIAEVKAKLAEVLLGGSERKLRAIEDLKRMRDGSLSYTLARRAQIEEMRTTFSAL